MHLEAMEVHERNEARVLAFLINMLAPSAHEQIKFVHLVEARFGAEQGDIGRVWRAPSKPFGSVDLRFPSEGAYTNAKRFCAEKLTASGMMIAGDRGALDKQENAAGKADLLFRRMQARPIRERS